MAPAAAKGLLEGVVEKPKRAKKQKGTQRRQNLGTSGAKPKVIQLHRQAVPKVKAEVSVSKAVSKAEEKKVIQAQSSAQVKSPIKPTSDTARLSAAAKVRERQTTARKAGPERKRLVMKPVEIRLPPLLPPLPANKPRVQAHQCLRWWAGAQGPSGRTRALLLSKVGKPAVPSHRARQ